jgi:thiol-disulfide isomerase/thioredoxin
MRNASSLRSMEWRVAVVLAAALAWVGCGTMGEEVERPPPVIAEDEEATAEVEPEPEPEPEPMRVGQELSFTAPKIWSTWDDGPEGAREYSLVEARGTVVLLHFWASWCSPCRVSMPYYEHLRVAHTPYDGPPRLVVVAVDMDEDAELARWFLEEVPVGFVTVHDAGSYIAEQLDIGQLPLTLLLDREGVVRFAQVGGEVRDHAALERALDALLAVVR